MSRESWEFDNNSSKEDIELTELNRRPGSYSDSCSSADLTTSCGRSITLAETSEDEAFYSAVSILNSSDENLLAFDSCRTSSRSLEAISTGALTRKTTYLERPSIKSASLQDHLGPSTRKVSSLDSLEKPSFRRASSVGGLTTKRALALEKPSIRRVKSLERLSSKKFSVCDSSQDFPEGSSSGKVTFQIPLGGHLTRSASSLEGPLNRRVSSLEEPLARRVSSLEEPLARRVSSFQEPLTRSALSLEGPLTREAFSFEGSLNRRASSLNVPRSPLKGPSTRRVVSLDPLEVPSTRRVVSLDPLEVPSTRRVVSLDPLEGSSTRRVVSLDPLEGPSTRRAAPLDPLKGPSTRRVVSLDPLEVPSTIRVASLDPLVVPSTRRVASLDPLEGPSTRTDIFSGSTEGSLSSVFQPNLSETETIEYLYYEPPAEQNGNFLEVFPWLNSFLRRQSRQMRHSVYYPLLLVALFAIPYSAGYMGCTHFYLCGGCPKLPYLIYFAGILGLLILFLQLTSVLSKRYFSPHLDGHEFNTWMVALCFPFFMILILEIFTVYMCEPVFIPPHKEFCAKVFYNYAYYINITVPIIILLLMIINLPGQYDPSEAE